MKLGSKFLATTLLVVGFAACASADITWTFSDVVFSDGDTLAGSFTTNDSVTAIDSFSLNMTGPHAFTITQMVDSYLPSEIGMANAGFSLYIDLFPSSNLTSAGGTIPIASGFDCGIEPCGTLLTEADGHDPELNGVAPEPLSLLLFGTGLLAIIAIARYKLPGGNR